MQDRHLWLRISAVGLPEGFEKKLVEEFSWTAQQAVEAIEEYRRFAYLSQITDQQVSPPREVDLVWHVHLLYTRHYTGAWQDVLKKPFHHEPAPAGTKESAFRQQYDETRALYLKEFGQFGAEKLWPSVAVLRRREIAAVIAVASFLVGFVSIILAAVLQNLALGLVAVAAILVFVVSLFFAASSNGGRSSFGVSSGGGDSGGCGD